MITMQTTRTPAPTEPAAFTLRDEGRVIGQVVEPRSTQVLGRGEGTVLLQRARDLKSK